MAHRAFLVQIPTDFPESGSVDVHLAIVTGGEAIVDETITIEVHALRTITGTVRDRDSGSPLRAVRIRALNGVKRKPIPTPMAPSRSRHGWAKRSASSPCSAAGFPLPAASHPA